MPFPIVVVFFTLGQMAAVVDAGSADVPPCVAPPAMPAIPAIDPEPVPEPVAAGAVAAVADELSCAGCEAASVSEVAASTRTPATATEAAPLHHSLAAVPMVPHRTRARVPRFFIEALLRIP
jgi:hypothetical protein